MLPMGITNIKPYAVYCCHTEPETYSVSIRDTVTMIGEYAFYGTDMRELTLYCNPLQVNMYAFGGNRELRNVNLLGTGFPDGNDASGWFTGSGNSEVGITLTVGENISRLPAYFFHKGLETKDPIVRVIRFEGDKPAVGTGFLPACSPRCGYPGGNSTWSTRPNLGSGVTPEWVDTSKVLGFGVCGYEAVWDVDLKGKLTISGHGEVYSYSSDPLFGSDYYPWGEISNQLRELSVESGITRLPGGFSYFGLTSATFAGSVYEIGPACFANNRQLTTVTFLGDKPDIAENAFTGDTFTAYYDASNATWKTLPQLDADTHVTWQAKDFADGWQKADGKWYYYEDGKPVTGWKQIGTKWYRFDSSGVMQTGWQKINNKWYYFNTSGDMVTGWKQIGSKWYRFNSSGIMQTGWQKINSKWYYFNGGGDMVTGWKQIGSKWYYFNSSGIMQTGWQKIGSAWYYFSSGGDMVTGWKQIGSKWYYFYSSGKMAASTWVGDYYLKSDGSMAVSEWVDNGRYYVDENGRWVKGKKR